MHAHPLELRQRIVDAYDRGEGSVRELAERFDVAPNTVQNYLTLRRRTGNVEVVAQQKNGPAPSIDARGLKILQALVLADNDRTIEEYIVQYAAKTKIRVSHSVMVRGLKRAGLVRKKRHYELRSKTVRRSSGHGKTSSAAPDGTALKSSSLSTSSART
jgi:transposase